MPRPGRTPPSAGSGSRLGSSTTRGVSRDRPRLRRRRPGRRARTPGRRRDPACADDRHSLSITPEPAKSPLLRIALTALGARRSVPRMDELERRLGRWVDAGLVTAEQAAAILAAESRAAEKGTGRSARRPARALDGRNRARLPRRVRGPGRRHRGGLARVVADRDGRAPRARLRGYALTPCGGISRAAAPASALKSLDTFLWFLSAGGAAFTAGLIAHDVLDLETRSISLWAGAAAAA